MKSIFWKVFLSFWLVLAVVLAVMLQISHYIASERATQVSELRRIDIVRDVDDALSRDGKEGFRRWLSSAVLPPAQTVYLLDDQGDDILGRAMPESVTRNFRRSQQRRPAPPGRGGRGGRGRPPVLEDPSGVSYLFMFGPTRPPVLGILSLPKVRMVLFLAALLVSALVCFALTRYLTAPLKPIMRASEALSDGNLDARVGDAVTSGDELGALARQFDDMAAALERQAELQRDLLRNVSHELRSPLARITIALDLAARQPGAIEAHLARIETETEHMDRLTGQVLDLARAQADDGDKPSISLVPILERVVDNANFEGAPRDIVIELDAAAALPEVPGDAELLHSALDNVVRNALRASAAGQVIRVTAKAVTDGAVIEVIDNGAGIQDGALLRTLFEPFRKGARSDGAGVGLALTAQVIERHNGTIIANNRTAPEHGLTVTITLPAKT
ncbi:MAG: HAMP domain-containing sensor histidine kinase [Pseudomonadota bacterium]